MVVFYQMHPLGQPEKYLFVIHTIIDVYDQSIPTIFSLILKTEALDPTDISAKTETLIAPADRPLPCSNPRLRDAQGS